jgi:hypothetical protein
VEQIHHSFGPTLPGRKWRFFYDLSLTHSPSLISLSLSLSLFLPPPPFLSVSPQRLILDSSIIFFSFVVFSLHFPSGACQRSRTCTRSVRPLTSLNLNPSAC